MSAATAAPLALALLAIVDAGFCGYRDAAGRNPRIRKLRYYRRAIRRGMASGVVGCLLVATLLGLLVATRPSAAVFQDILERAVVLVVGFGVYATLVLTALGAWLAAEADVRTLASVLILGPFTLIRPLWILAGCAIAALGAATWQGAAAAIAAGCVQLAIEPWLGRGWRAGSPLPLS